MQENKRTKQTNKQTNKREQQERIKNRGDSVGLEYNGPKRIHNYRIFNIQYSYRIFNIQFWFVADVHHRRFGHSWQPKRKNWIPQLFCEFDKIHCK